MPQQDYIGLNGSHRFGGVKEKVLAAHRNGIRSVILPEGNRKDLDDIPKEVLDVTVFSFVKTIASAIPLLFADKSFPLPAGESAAQSAPAQPDSRTPIFWPEMGTR